MKGIDFMNNYLVKVCFRSFDSDSLRREYEITAKDKSTAIQLAYGFLRNTAIEKFNTINGKYRCISCIVL